MNRWVMAIVVAVLSGFSFASETDVRLYRPFSESEGQATVQVAQKLKGWCWQQSKVDKRLDAFRCAIKDKVFDPCFVKIYGDKKQAVCPTSPWNGQAVLIELDNSLQMSQEDELDMSRHYPWGIELTDGSHCQAIIDEQPLFDNMPVRYQCNGNGVLLGHLQRCKGMWQMLHKDSSGVSTIDIKRVWF